MTTKSRLNLTLDDDLALILDRISAAQRRPRTKVVMDLLTAIQPQLDDLADLFETAQRAPQDLHEKFGEVLVGVRGNLEPLVEHIVGAQTEMKKLADAHYRHQGPTL